MGHSEWVVYIGYIASLLIATAMLMSNIKKLRIINMFGAMGFAIYGYLVGAYPVMILNSFNTLVNIVHLYRLMYTKTFFNINCSFTGEEVFIKRFLAYYQEEIATYFPEFNLAKIKRPRIILISREMDPVGLFVYECLDNNEIFIHLDFACPEYRDFKNSRYLFEEERDFLMKEGHTTLVTRTTNKIHRNYLTKRMGFKASSEDPTLFKRAL